MTVMIGDLDIGSAIVNLDYQVKRTQAILEWIANNNSGLRLPGDREMAAIDQKAVAEIEAKYPGVTSGSPTQV